MLRVSLREIRAHAVQFALSVLAVVLGVGFVAGTFVLRAMLADTFDSIVESQFQGDAYLRGADVTPPGEGPPTGPESFADGRNAVRLDLAEAISAVDGVSRALPTVQGPVVIVGADGKAVINGQAPSIALALYADDPSVRLVQGSAPTAGDEIALESSALESSGLAVGDSTSVVLGDALREVEVVGEGAFPSPAAGATLAFVDPDTAAQVFAPEGLVPSIAVFAEAGVDPAELVEAMRDEVVAAHPDEDLEAVTGQDVRDEAAAAIQEIIGFIGTFLLVFAAIALFVGAFIIGNTFAMSVRQRQREYALLRALGASPTQVFGVVLAQAFAVGLVGSGVGLVSGIVLVDLIRAILRRFGMTLSGDAPVSAATVALCLAAGTAVSMIAAILPARRAALTAPVEAMRDDVVVTERSLRWRGATGLVLLAVGLAGTYAAVRLATDDEPWLRLGPGPWLGIGAGAVLLGTLAISPVIARATLGVLAAPLVATIKPLGRLARGNVMRNPRRTAATAGALMIGMALVAACTVLAASARASTTAIVESEFRADLVVMSATRTVPGEAVAAVQALDGVARADAIDRATVVVSGPGLEPTSTSVLALPPDALGTTMEVPSISGDLDSLDDGEVAVHSTAAARHGWAVGDELTLRTDAAEREVRIGAVTTSRVLAADVIMGADLMAELDPQPQQVLVLLVDEAPGATNLHTRMNEALTPFVVVSALTETELTDQFADQVNQALVIIYALLALSIVIAVLGIMNTLALAVIERTREIGLVRAVGLGRMQLSGTIVIESVLTAVFGTAVGLVVGVGLAAAVRSVYESQGLAVLAVPWDQLLAILALSAVVGVLAAVWPALRASRLPVLDAIAHE